MTARNTQSELARLRERLVDFCRIRDRGYDVRSDFSPLWVLDQIDMLAEPEGEREELPELQPGGLEIVGLPAGTIRHEVTDRGVLRLVFTPAEEPAPSEAEIEAWRREIMFQTHSYLARDDRTIDLDQINRAVALMKRAAAPAAAEGGKMRTALAALETLATKQQKVELRDAAHRILHGYSPCMNCGKWTRTNECHWPCNPIKTIEPEPAPAADAEFEAAITEVDSWAQELGEENAYPDTPMSREETQRIRKLRDDAIAALRALHARRIAEAEARVAAKATGTIKVDPDDDTEWTMSTAKRYIAMRWERDEARAEVERLRAALVRQDNIDSRLRAEIGNLREHVESKNRLLPSLISEGKQMETERAVAAEREVERLRARVEVLERVRKAANDVAVIDNPLGQGGMAAELELRAALLAAKEGEDGN